MLMGGFAARDYGFRKYVTRAGTVGNAATMQAWTAYWTEDYLFAVKNVDLGRVCLWQHASDGEPEPPTALPAGTDGSAGLN